MLTLFLAYGAYRNARRASRLLESSGAPSPKGDAETNVILVTYGLLLFFLWPLLIPAALIRYVPNANPFIVLLTPAPMLLSLLILGPEFYFVYSFLFLIFALNFTITALQYSSQQEDTTENKSTTDL